jgi:hypothetical protein
MKSIIAVLFCSQLVSSLSLGNIAADTVDHIVVLPDIHGDLEFFLLSVLTAARRTNYPDLTLSALEDLLISKGAAPNPEGVPSRTIAIQLGDVANRGPGSKQCFAALYGLESILGWKLIPLYGNHELMAFTGTDDQYVHEMEYEMFGGAANRAIEFSREGSLWRRIQSRSILVARLGGSCKSSVGTLFVHAGIESAWLNEVGDSLSQSVDYLNSLTRSAMSSPGLAIKFFAGKSSPLWTRAFEKNSRSDDWCDGELNQILEHFKVSRIVVGHCPNQSKRVETRCGGRIILADVRMSRWMHDGGQPMALIMTLSHLESREESESQIDSIVAHYLDAQDPSREYSQEITVYSDITEITESENHDKRRSYLPSLGRSVSLDSYVRLVKNRPDNYQSALISPRLPCVSPGNCQSVQLHSSGISRTACCRLPPMESVPRSPKP